MTNPSTEMRITFDAFNEMVDLDHLQEHPQQTNTHTKEQEIRLALVMKEHGVSQAIHVVKGTKTICFGHLRKMAALRNGWTKYPVVYQTFANKAEEIMKVTSDNAIASWAEINLGKVNEQMIDLGPDINPDLFGIENFVIEPADKFAPGCDEDEVPEQVEPKTKLGDIYQLGSHRLMCGDSTSIDAVEKLMNGEKAEMLFTDPPYGVKYDDTKHKNYGTYKASKFGMIKGDDKEFQWSDFEWLDLSEQIWFGANYYCKQLPQSGSWYVWDKKTEAMQENGMLFTNDFELAWSKQKHKQEICRKIWAGAINKEKGETRLHPTQKPVSLIEWFFERIKGDKILDLFGGSGSTLIACEKTNRKCFMSELDPHYCDVIVARWEKFTGKKAELIKNADQ